MEESKGEDGGCSTERRAELGPAHRPRPQPSAHVTLGGASAWRRLSSGRKDSRADSRAAGPGSSAGAEALLHRGRQHTAETMELLAAPLHTGSVPWQRLLFTVSLLSYWSSPTTAQVHIEPQPPHVAEGKSVLLLVHNLPENLYSMHWYKGKPAVTESEIARYIIDNNVNKTGQAYSGRETIFPNGSLLFQNVTLNDTGFYTFQIQNRELDRKETSVQLHIYQPVTQPSLNVTNSTVPEKGSVVFSCRSSDPGISIQWIFNNQNLKLTERTTLSENNSRLSIEPVMGEDAGEYQCEVSNPVSSEKSAPVRLVVNTAPEPGSSGLPAGAIAGIVVGVVAGVALIAALAYFLYSRKSGRGSDQHSLSEHTPSANNHSLCPSDASPKKDEVAYSVLDFKAQKPKPPPAAASPQASETVYSQVKK